MQILPIVSNHLYVVKETNTYDDQPSEEPGHLDNFGENNQDFGINREEKNNMEVPEEEVMDKFFGGFNWDCHKDNNQHNFFVTMDPSNDQSSGSKDLFKDPFYPDVAKSISRDSTEKQPSFDYSAGLNDSVGYEQKDRDTASIESQHNDREIASRSTASYSGHDNYSKSESLKSERPSGHNTSARSTDESHRSARAPDYPVDARSTGESYKSGWTSEYPTTLITRDHYNVINSNFLSLFFLHCIIQKDRK